VAHRARAWWDGQLVAESAAALVTEEPNQPPELWFPRTDVDPSLFRGDPDAVTWTLPGTSRPPVTDWVDWEEEGAPEAVDGRDAVRSRDGDPGLVTFDHDRVRVELLDGGPGDDPRDVTVKRFPTWGDARDLVDAVDVRPAGERRWTGIGRADLRRPVVEGSQLLGQAVVAAMRHAPGRRVVSGHLIFARAVDAREPVTIELGELSSGRTFTALSVTVGQSGKPRAGGTLLLGVPAPEVIRHEEPAPPCAGPYESEPFDMSVTGRDLRVVDAAYTSDPKAPAGPPVIDAWLRFRSVPDDPALHAGLLTQFTGHLSIAAALRPHEGVSQAQAHRTLSMGVNAITIALHRDVRVDRWLRYHHRSTFAGDGMTHAECAVYTETGDRVASFTVEAMVRGFGRAP
jgi:acyl-CoA thioesterase-2